MLHRPSLLFRPVDATTAQLVVEQASDAFFVLDPAGCVQACNPAAERLTGLPAVQARGQALGSLLGDDVAALLAAPRDLVHHEVLGRRSDGTLRQLNLSLSVRRDTAGRCSSLVCALRDATAARVAQDGEALRARYRDLFESLPDAIVIVNDTGHIVHVNSQAEALFGHGGPQLLGQMVEVLLPPRLRERHVPQRGSFLRQPGLRPMGRGLELHGMRCDGQEFPVAISLSPIELDGRRLVISAIRDISDRKAIEQSLHLKNVELERANRAKDHFLAAMSHELRTPLNAILGFTGLLLMRLSGPLTDTQERQLSHVQSSGRHLLSLINDLLDLARIGSGQVDLQCEPVDARLVLDEVAGTLRPVAEGRGLGLHAELPAGGITVHADRRALRQVMLNLMGNAIKFTAQGHVLVSATPRQHDGQPHWALAVSDTGVGISADDQKRLFQAFVQVGDWRTRRGEGTGLGLHLSRQLVELMGGRIEVHSEPGRGSTFTVLLRQAG